MIGLLACGAFAAVSLANPVLSKPPTITGSANYNSVLTCHPGTWSSDAVSFGYAWTYGGGGPTFASTQKWKVDAPRLDYNVVCVVTARDAHGGSTQATSNGVVPGPGIARVKITKISAKHGKVTVSGVAGPSPALLSAFGYRPEITLDRKLNIGLLQLAGPKTLGRSGRFTISAHDTRGKHTYVLTFIPAVSSKYATAEAMHKLKVTK
jgi:hypothetical protein